MSHKIICFRLPFKVFDCYYTTIVCILRPSNSKSRMMVWKHNKLLCPLSLTDNIRQAGLKNAIQNKSSSEGVKA